tara:strand:+ start:622 stop:1071 length:450 start_codon:yes stop_codon:yes gene_type:complete
MLAELAVFTTAAKTVAKCIQAGRELSTVATSIGKMAESKDALQTKLSKKKNRTFSTVETEFEEFMALEEIRQREEDLLKLMVYQGRVGLKDDFVKFQVENRRQRKEAELARKKAQQERNELILSIAGIGSIFALTVGAIGALIYFVKGF